jgi:rod shape-determining protein MreC
VASPTLARRALDYALAGLLLCVPAAIMHANFRDPAKHNGFDRAVLTVSSPLQSAASWLVEGVGSIWNRYIWNVDSDRRLRELEVKYQTVVMDNARLRAQLREAQPWRELAGLRDRTPADSVGAQVVAAGQSPYFRVTRLTLDRPQAVRDNMPVVAPEGVVGRIARVYGDYADVQLAVDKDSAIPVMISATGARGVLRGVGSENAYTCRIAYLKRAEEVKVGDLVVTSGLGGVFPSDMPVGTVKKVVRTEYELYQEVEVEPAVDFGRLGSVLVLLSQPPPPDPEAPGPARKKTPAKAFGAVPR